MRRSWRGEIVLAISTSPRYTGITANQLLALEAFGVSHSLAITLTPQHCAAMMAAPQHLSCAWTSWMPAAVAVASGDDNAELERRLTHRYTALLLKHLHVNVIVLHPNVAVQGSPYDHAPQRSPSLLPLNTTAPNLLQRLGLWRYESDEVIMYLRAALAVPTDDLTIRGGLPVPLMEAGCEEGSAVCYWWLLFEGSKEPLGVRIARRARRKVRYGAHGIVSVADRGPRGAALRRIRLIGLSGPGALSARASSADLIALGDALSRVAVLGEDVNGGVECVPPGVAPGFLKHRMAEAADNGIDYAQEVRQTRDASGKIDAAATLEALRGASAAPILLVFLAEGESLGLGSAWREAGGRGARVRPRSCIV